MAKRMYIVIVRELPEGGFVCEDGNGPQIMVADGYEVDPFGDTIYSDKPATLGVRLKNRIKEIFAKPDSDPVIDHGDRHDRDSA